MVRCNMKQEKAMVYVIVASYMLGTAIGFAFVITVLFR